MLPSKLRFMARGLFDMLLPPRCLNCTVLIQEPQSICSTCWKNLNFIMPPYCACCGWPFEFEIGAGVLCGRCIRQPPLYQQARAALGYDDNSKRMILNFKHGDALHLTPLLARWMYQSGKDLLSDTDYMVPVPLHWSRLFKRQYNQAAVLCHALAQLSGCPVAARLLRRVRATPPQGKFKAAQRHDNVKGAFTIDPAWQTRIPGQRFLLIDDVITSGATLQYCTAVLLEAGAAQVNMLTLARVI